MKPSPAGLTKTWSIAHQRRRIEALLAAVRPTLRRYFNAQGESLLEADKHHFHLRERIYTCQALMSGRPAADDVALANAILQAAAFHPCDFSTLSMIELLLRFPDRISAANGRKLRAHIASQLVEVRRPHCAYNGYNDNFPSMDTAILVLGGELLADRTAVEAGLDNLYSLRDLLTRRGFFSEYNSPTYAGVTLHALAETAWRARHPEARRLARQAARRQWLDIASHWHPAVSAQAGPQSRAYHHDSILMGSIMQTVMWVAFGELVWPSPLERYFGAQAHGRFERSLHRLAYLHTTLAGYGMTIQPVDDGIARLAFAKSYPFRVRGTAEMGTFHTGDYRRTPEGAVQHVSGRGVDFGADQVWLTTYMEADFAVGTSTRGFLSGTQSEVFLETHTRRPGSREAADVRSVFARYLVGPTSLSAQVQAGLIQQQGLAWAIQDDTRVLALYHPNGSRHRRVDSLRLCLLLPEHEAPVEEIWIGQRRLRNGRGEARSVEWVVLCDGPMRLAFYPLIASDLGRRVAIRCEHEAGLRVISFYNYDGPARDFDRHGLPSVGNGFVFEASTRDRHRTVPAFLRDLRRAELSDAVLMEMRRVRYRRAGREMLLWLDPVRQTIKAAAVNGRQIAYQPLEIDGLDLGRVPWVGRPTAHTDIRWWQRIEKRPAIPGLEGVSGRLVRE